MLLRAEQAPPLQWGERKSKGGHPSAEATLNHPVRFAATPLRRPPLTTPSASRRSLTTPSASRRS